MGGECGGIVGVTMTFAHLPHFAACFGDKTIKRKERSHKEASRLKKQVKIHFARETGIEFAKENSRCPKRIFPKRRSVVVRRKVAKRYSELAVVRAHTW